MNNMLKLIQGSKLRLRVETPPTPPSMYQQLKKLNACFLLPAEKM